MSEDQQVVIAASVLAGIAGLCLLSIVAGWAPNWIVGMAQLLTPWWVALTAALSVVVALQGHRSAPGLGAAVVVFGLVVLWPRLHRSRRQVRDAQAEVTFTLSLANLYLDNEQPDVAIGQLLDAAPDVLVMTELTVELLGRFDELGGAADYPQRIHPDPIEGEYEVGIFSRRRLDDPRVETSGSIRVVRATVRPDGWTAPLEVIAAHPVAPVGKEDFRTWNQELRDLGSVLDASSGPTVALGDFNAGTLQPRYEALVRGRFRDAHDEAGVALKPSWGIAPWLPRWIPTFVARLDHLLVSEEVRVVSIEDLDPVGSDHRPFLAGLAATDQGG